MGLTVDDTLITFDISLSDGSVSNQMELVSWTEPANVRDGFIGFDMVFFITAPVEDALEGCSIVRYNFTATTYKVFS